MGKGKTSARYLQKKGGSGDPTMTRVADPYLFRVGDYIISGDGWDQITALEDEVYPNTRLAHLRACGKPPRGARVWDIFVAGFLESSNIAK